MMSARDFLFLGILTFNPLWFQPCSSILRLILFGISLKSVCVVFLAPLDLMHLWMMSIVPLVKNTHSPQVGHFLLGISLTYNMKFLFKKFIHFSIWVFASLYISTEWFLVFISHLEDSTPLPLFLISQSYNVLGRAVYILYLESG